jgi:hypothetical protein
MARPVPLRPVVFPPYIGRRVDSFHKTSPYKVTIKNTFVICHLFMARGGKRRQSMAKDDCSQLASQLYCGLSALSFRENAI